MSVVCRHSNGYYSNPSEDLPKLLESSKGAIGVVYDEEGEVLEVRNWTGRKWELLTGTEREYALDWFQS